MTRPAPPGLKGPRDGAARAAPRLAPPAGERGPGMGGPILAPAAPAAAAVLGQAAAAPPSGLPASQPARRLLRAEPRSQRVQLR